MSALELTVLLITSSAIGTSIVASLLILAT